MSEKQKMKETAKRLAQLKEEKILANKVVIQILMNREYKTDKELGERDVRINAMNNEIAVWEADMNEFLNIAGK